MQENISKFQSCFMGYNQWGERLSLMIPNSTLKGEVIIEFFYTLQPLKNTGTELQMMK